MGFPASNLILKRTQRNGVASTLISPSRSMASGCCTSNLCLRYLLYIYQKYQLWTQILELKMVRILWWPWTYPYFFDEEVLSMNTIPFHVIVSKPRCRTSLKNTKTQALEFKNIRVDFFSWILRWENTCSHHRVQN